MMKMKNCQKAGRLTRRDEQQYHPTMRKGATRSPIRSLARRTLPTRLEIRTQN